MDGYQALAAAIVTQSLEDIQHSRRSLRGEAVAFLRDLKNTLWGDVLGLSGPWFTERLEREVQFRLGALTRCGKCNGEGRRVDEDGVGERCGHCEGHGALPLAASPPSGMPQVAYA